MSLKALLLCSDEKIVRVLRRVLSDLDIGIEHCTDPDGAIRKLTRQRFEAVIIDCTDLKIASSVLKSARSAPCNKRAIAVAIMDGHCGLRTAFDMGAHFVLHKPHRQIAIQVPVTLSNPATGFRQTTTNTDLSEGGLAVQFPKQQKDPGPWLLSFTLPVSEKLIEVGGQIAWQNPGGQIGVRFASLPMDLSHELRLWLNQNSPESEKDDPPVRCKLSDLSLGGCYLEIASPFPARTRIVLSMRAGKHELRVEGVIRVMHPEIGMGVEFTQTTTEQRDHVERFIKTLMDAGDLLPELLVEPEGLDSSSTEAPKSNRQPSDLEDPLLDLFQQKASLPAELFLKELRNQRTTHRPDTTEEETILPV
ncbi:MAG: hypothetical protein DMG81_08375 [Acidobacteria bacterium]|nr:MAG: hypothetical protein DMG81_08375 [Acidobacteriota bacterium]